MLLSLNIIIIIIFDHLIILVISKCLSHTVSKLIYKYIVAPSDIWLLPNQLIKKKLIILTIVNMVFFKTFFIGI